VFPIDAGFFGEFLERPGGIVDYLTAFLSVTLAIDWLGSLVFTALAALICLAARRFFNTMAGTNVGVVWLFPSLLILALLGQYLQPVELCVGLAVALWLANVYLLVGQRHDAVRLLAFLVLSVFTYLLTTGLYFAFACLCGVYELGVKRRLLLGLFAMLCAATVPVAGAQWFDLGLADAFGGLWLYFRHWLAAPSSVPPTLTTFIGLSLFVPVVGVILGWRRRFRFRAHDGGAAEGRRLAWIGPRWRRRWASVRWALPAAVFVAILITADFLLFDSPKKCLLRMVASAEARQWDDVIACFERLPPSDAHYLDLRTIYHLNRAPYYVGDLPERMFSYPHVLNEPTLALVRGNATTMANTSPRQCSEILFDLGRINESEHMAHEALETHGDRPDILKRLVYINVLKGRPEAARRFLALLECSFLHGSWARRLSRQLDGDPTLSDAPEVASRRDLMVTRDSVNDVGDLEVMLLALLERNPRNRMAFEYLMAHYLTSRQLDKLVANLRRLDDFDYPRMPTHYEEALIMYLDTGGSRETVPAKNTVRPETWRRHAAFQEAFQAFSRDQPKEAYGALYDEFGDTYFFFFIFGQNIDYSKGRG